MTSIRSAPTLLRSVSGVTLVELLIAVGLFGVLALAMSEVFVGFMSQNKRAEGEIELNEMIHEFQDRMDLELGNATQIIQCSCGNTHCRFDDTVASNDCGDASAPCGDPILTWETEATNSPGSDQSAQSGCNSASGYWGCKQFRVLRVTPATDTTPGKITIEDPISNSVLSTLSGVTEVYCGRSQPELSTGFSLRIRTKARMRNLNDTTATSFESWKKGGQNWLMGIHREFNLQTNLRNLSQPGIHYGKSSTNRNCKKDNASATSSDECCSGYFSLSRKACLAASACMKSGIFANTAQACCSHQRNGARKCE